MTDVYTMHTAMIAGIKFKSKDGIESEAMVQIQTWSAALHSHMYQLIERTLCVRAAEDPMPSEVQITALPTIGYIAAGHNWQFYIITRIPSVRSVTQNGDPQTVD